MPSSHFRREASISRPPFLLSAQLLARLSVGLLARLLVQLPVELPAVLLAQLLVYISATLLAHLPVQLPVELPAYRLVYRPACESVHLVVWSGLYIEMCSRFLPRFPYRCQNYCADWFRYFRASATLPECLHLPALAA